MRLALSRMDTIGANLLVMENQRPPLHYQAFFAPTDVFDAQLENLDSNNVLQSSPRLTEKSPLVKLHFEFRETGPLVCPQLPVASQRDLALSKGIEPIELDALSARLAVPKDNVFIYARSEASGEKLAGAALLVADGNNLVIGNLVGHVPLGKLAAQLGKGDLEDIMKQLTQGAGGGGHDEEEVVKGE